LGLEIFLNAVGEICPKIFSVGFPLGTFFGLFFGWERRRFGLEIL
jgi:hypothetical protein